jgi:pimeloyl-ACP methyl ester carboxylesterase
VLILPGLGTSIDFWQLVIPALAERHHVVAIDPPGIGKSDKPDQCYRLDCIAAQIVTFMDAKGIDRAHLIGGSMGGHLALILAHRIPGRVEKLVLMGSCGAWPEPSPYINLAIRLLWSDALVTDHVRRNWEHIYNGLFERESEVRSAILRYQLARLADLKVYRDEGRAFSRSLRSIFYSSCRPFMSEIPQPALLIWGEHDRIHLNNEAEYLRDNLPDARLVIVPGAGHEVMIDDPGRFNRLVLAFLDE